MDRDAWLRARRTVIGASEVAALFGLQPPYAASHLALWYDRKGELLLPDVNNERARWGLQLEAAIAEGCAAQEGWEIAPAVWLRHPVILGMGCTPDRYIVGGDEFKRRGRGLLEVKNVDWLQHRRSWTAGEPPVHIVLQLQHQLACTGCRWGAVGALVGGNHPEIYRYEARAPVIAEIERKVHAFWRSIHAGTPPAPDGSDSAHKTLQALFPDAIEDIIDLTADNELPALCQELQEGAAAMSSAKKRASVARNNILAKLGGHKMARAAEDWFISGPRIEGQPGRLITAEDVGKPWPGSHTGYRRITAKQHKREAA